MCFIGQACRNAIQHCVLETALLQDRANEQWREYWLDLQCLLGLPA
jgi:hypothetical protein